MRSISEEKSILKVSADINKCNSIHAARVTSIDRAEELALKLYLSISMSLLLKNCPLLKMQGPLEMVDNERGGPPGEHENMMRVLVGKAFSLGIAAGLWSQHQMRLDGPVEWLRYSGWWAWAHQACFQLRGKD